MIDLAADAQGGLSHLEVWPLVTHDCGVQGVTGYDDGIIPDFRMPLGTAEHEGGKNNERVCSSHEKAPMLEFLKCRFCIGASGFQKGLFRFLQGRGIEQFLLNFREMAFRILEAGVEAICFLRPAIIGLRLEKRCSPGRFQIPVSIRAIGIHIHEGLYQECVA